jgi:hypothetical protein
METQRVFLLAAVHVFSESYSNNGVLIDLNATYVKAKLQQFKYKPNDTSFLEQFLATMSKEIQ